MKYAFVRARHKSSPSAAHVRCCGSVAAAITIGGTVSPASAASAMRNCSRRLVRFTSKHAYGVIKIWKALRQAVIACGKHRVHG